MPRLGISAVLVLASSLPLLAQEAPKRAGEKSHYRSTAASIDALANSEQPIVVEKASQSKSRNSIDSVDALSGIGGKNEQPEPKPRTVRAKPEGNAPKEPARADRPKGAAKEQADEVREKAGQERPQKQLRDRENARAGERLDRQHGAIGWQPVMGNQQFGNQWMADPWADPWAGQWGNGFSSSRIIGYRTYSYRSGFASPFLYPSYFGYSSYFGGSGFFGPAVMPSISAPVTTRYDDPVTRQHKMMDESIRRFAEDPMGERGR